MLKKLLSVLCYYIDTLNPFLITIANADMIEHKITEKRKYCLLY